MRIHTPSPARQCLLFSQVLFSVSFPLCLVAQASQNPAKPAIQIPPAPPGPGHSNDRQSCPLMADGAIPINATVEARLGMLLESNHQKPGKNLWVNSVYEMDLHACHMYAGAPVFGTVTGALSSRTPSHSEISLAFDAADCVGHSKQPLKFVVIGVYAPPDKNFRGHDAVPTEVHDRSRQISETATSTEGYDANLNSDSRRGVRPGMVVGYSRLTLEPQGGPHCSSRLISTDSKLVLVPGTILLLVPHSEE